ncbi:MAG: DUF3108 domain-containing protein [Mediterranea sp.]|nr:DUF3108 domain-containing protein [Mediterranea sp.]
MIKLILVSFITLFPIQLKAQCEVENNSFRGGEYLEYDLYFKYGLIFTKAGISTMSVADARYKNKSAYRMTLTANSLGAAKAIFLISDTLTSYTTKGIVPLAYLKDAHEGGDYRTERATYDYSTGKVKLRNINKKNEDLRYDTTLVSNDCMYDMLSIVYYARTLNYGNMKKGDEVTVSFLSGRKKVNMTIVYQGVESVLANDKRKYNCIKLSLMINERAFEDKNEAMKVYITEDPNRIPIRIDSKLKVGSTRALLKSYKGQRN